MSRGDEILRWDDDAGIGSHGQIHRTVEREWAFARSWLYKNLTANR